MPIQNLECLQDNLQGVASTSQGEILARQEKENIDAAIEQIHNLVSKCKIYSRKIKLTISITRSIEDIFSNINSNQKRFAALAGLHHQVHSAIIKINANEQRFS